jgi:SAM-dependent methyltransferase
MSVPQRLLWAVDTLDVRPGDRILEIGCGRGIAVELVAAKLRRGSVLAIDRSAVAIAAAETRNRDAIEAEKVRLLRTALADLEEKWREAGTRTDVQSHSGRRSRPPVRRFDKAFAVNVNLFWLDPAKELAVLRRLLEPEASLHLFFEPPASQLARIERDCARNLAAHGFEVADVLQRDLGSARAICIVAH